MPQLFWAMIRKGNKEEPVSICARMTYSISSEDNGLVQRGLIWVRMGKIHQIDETDEITEQLKSKREPRLLKQMNKGYCRNRCAKDKSYFP